MIFLPHRILLYLIIFLLFCIDVWSFFFFEKQIFHLLLCFLIMHTYYSRSVSPTLTILSFLAIESFIMYGIFGLSLLYAIPATIFIFTFHTYLYITILYPVFASSTCLLLAILLIQGYLLGLPVSVPYTISTIFANIMITIAFSLKSKMGKTRQSLIHETV